MLYYAHRYLIVIILHILLNIFRINFIAKTLRNVALQAFEKKNLNVHTQHNYIFFKLYII